jgi:hypothetical protein
LIANGARLPIGYQPLLPVERSAVFHATRVLPVALKH